MPSGLASLVLQASVPFTVVLGAVFLRERLSAPAGASASLVAVAGLTVDRGPPGGRGLGRRARPGAADRRRRSGLGLRQHLQPPGPGAEAAAPDAVDVGDPAGPAAGARRCCSRVRSGTGTSLRTAFTLEALPAVLGLLYIVLVASLLGYGLWNTLLARHASSVVAPFAMLVPVVGVLQRLARSSTRCPDLVELVAGALVVGRRALRGAHVHRRPTSGGRDADGPRADAAPGARRRRDLYLRETALRL